MNEDGSSIAARRVAEINEADHAGRIERVQELQALMAGFPDGAWMLGGEETELARSDAFHAYLYGCFLASLLASHVACERFLAGVLAGYSDDQVPHRWERWGLGPLASWCTERGWIDAEIGDRLLELAETRKVIAHYRRPAAPGTLVRRMFSGSSDEREAEHLQDLLRLHALRSLQTCHTLIFGGYGPFGNMPR